MREEMDDEFTVDELYRFIRITDDPYQNCGLDEVLALLAEYIGDKRIVKEVDKYIDFYYDDIGLGRRREEDE
jgi:hypothetical protein